jgi:hypothetical protein
MRQPPLLRISGEFSLRFLSLILFSACSQIMPQLLHVIDAENIPMGDREAPPDWGTIAVYVSLISHVTFLTSFAGTHVLEVVRRLLGGTLWNGHGCSKRQSSTSRFLKSRDIIIDFVRV